MSGSAISLLMIDDEPAVASAMARWLRDTPGLLWLGNAQSVKTGLELAAQLRPNLILLDLDMVLDALAPSIEAMIEAGGGAHIIMFTGYANARLISESLLAGAAGYITKETEPARMLQLLLAAGAGHTVLCPSSLEITRQSSS